MSNFKKITQRIRDYEGRSWKGAQLEARRRLQRGGGGQKGITPQHLAFMAVKEALPRKAGESEKDYIARVTLESKFMIAKNPFDYWEALADEYNDANDLDKKNIPFI